MAVFEWVGQHPFLTVILVIIILGGIEEIVRAARGKR